MNTTPRMCWCLALLPSVIMLTGGGVAWSRAARENAEQSARLSRIMTSVESLARRRSELPRWATHAPSTDALAPQVSAALTSAGLPASVMKSLSADSGAGGVTGGSATHIRRRRATALLQPVTLPQLGRFLQQWRQRQPMWTVAALDVQPEAVQAGSEVAKLGGDLPLRVTVALESLSVETRAKR